MPHLRSAAWLAIPGAMTSTPADLVAISSGALTARINPLGAELTSLVDATGAEWMTDADPAWWTGHAPVLFPIIGSLAGDTLRHDGQSYTLQRHGFARRSRFELVAHDAASATFRLSDSAETRSVYPFAFTLELTFAVEGTRLAMTATIANPGEAPLPFSFGFHPAFAWPLPGSSDRHAHRVVFAQPEPGAIHRLRPGAGTLLSETFASPVEGRVLPLREALFEDDAVVWIGLASRALTYGVEGGPAIDVAFPNTDTLGLWQVPGAHYICIEPWAGHADPDEFTGDFVDKPGVILLAAGESRSLRMDVSLRGARQG